MTSARQATRLAIQLADDSVSPRLKAEVLDRAGVVARRQGRAYTADRFYRRALRHARLATRSAALVARIEAHRSIALGYLHRREQALTALQRTLAYERATGDLRGAAMTLNNIGFTLSEMKRFEEALDYFSRSISLKEQLGDTRGIAQTLHNRGKLHYDRREYPEAMSDFSESLRLRMNLARDPHGVAQSQLALARLAEKRGDFLQARDLAQASLESMLSIGDTRGESLAKALLNELRNRLIGPDGSS